MDERFNRPAHIISNCGMLDEITMYKMDNN